MGLLVDGAKRLLSVGTPREIDTVNAHERGSTTGERVPKSLPEK
jgi:hypothetical protein